MDNSKRNVHSSGPLGMLLKGGQVKRITENEKEPKAYLGKTSPQYFKTPTGVEFAASELIYVDPSECEPWVYANRQEEELGDIQELIESLKVHKQLQPALIRNHPNPHDNVKYEIIFGRRRHLACLSLKMPFLVILKEIDDIKDAIAYQDAENKLRNNVSNYSNAKLYQKLINDGIFKNEKELAQKLQLPYSTLNDLMAYAKIPEEIARKIPNIHSLSKQIALKIVFLVNQSPTNTQKIVVVANEIGKTILSPAKLETAIQKPSIAKQSCVTKNFQTPAGLKLFSLSFDSRGTPRILLNKHLGSKVNLENFCQHILEYLEKELSSSGAPD